MRVDVLVALQHGDEGKGKISASLNEDYDCYVKFSAGPNCGHSVYVNEKKLVFHQVPSGILKKKPCLISSQCIVDIEKLNKELFEIAKFVENPEQYLYIAYNCHIITPECIEQDIKSDKIGTTHSGIGPTYANKCLRVGKRMSDEKTFKLVEPFEFLSKFEKIFMEGSQGFELDIDCGDYPYVTSSSCITGAIFLNGIPPHISPRVIGVAKIYETYVGTKSFQPKDDEDLKQIQIDGEEFGATTGRMRQCGWLNLKRLIRAHKINGVNVLYINKCDIIKRFKMYDENENLIEFNSLEDMKNYIRKFFDNVIFSGNKYGL